MAELALKIYADKTCTKQISMISWKNKVELTTVKGELVPLENTAEGGETAEAEVWIRNESHYDFVVTKISFPDPRVTVDIETGWLIPQKPTKIRLLAFIQKNPSPEDVIKSQKFIIQGYYIFK